MAKRSPIKIKKSKQGSLRRKAKTGKGKNIPSSKLNSMAKSKNKNTKRKAIFAKNARKWRHK
jgi:hypothetical protein